jgi:dienelactone hydrolase
MRNHWLGQVRASWQNWQKRYEERTTPEQIISQQKYLREKFLEALGPWPQRTPLKPQITGTIQRQGYYVENVIFQSQPDFYVTASLFLPNNDKYKAPYPGVLVPCGHHSDARMHDEYQSMGALLALNGMAALVFDPIDQGERMQLIDQQGNYSIWGVQGHTMLGVGSILLGRNTAWFEIFDGMRAIDYMQSRGEIDPKRIGCTGNSGGGTQTSYLMSLDDRIIAAAPSCYLHRLSRQIETSFGDAEQNIHAQLDFGMEHADYMTMRAPMPLLICAATKDFFDIEATWDSFRYAKRLYTKLGFSERVDIMENDQGHNYNTQQRQAVAGWMARWLCNRDEPVKEPTIEVIPNQQMWCTPKGQVMLLPGAKTAYDINADYEKELAVQRQEIWANTEKNQLLEQVRKIAGIRKLSELPTPQIEKTATVTHLSYQVEKLIIKPTDDIYLPALLFNPQTEITQATLYLNQQGKEIDADAAGPIEQLLKEGNIVLAVDLPGCGETQPNGKFYYVPDHFDIDWQDVFTAYLLNQSYVGIRAESILICARYLAGDVSNNQDNTVNLISIGDVGVPALHAAALESDLFKSVEISRSLTSWSSVINTPMNKNQLANTVHGALKIYDLPDLAATLGKKLSNRSRN